MVGSVLHNVARPSEPAKLVWECSYLFHVSWSPISNGS